MALMNDHWTRFKGLNIFIPAQALDNDPSASSVLQPLTALSCALGCLHHIEGGLWTGKNNNWAVTKRRQRNWCTHKHMHMLSQGHYPLQRKTPCSNAR